LATECSIVFILAVVPFP